MKAWHSFPCGVRAARTAVFAVILGVLAALLPAQTYIHVYRLGEDDLGAVAGNTVNATTTDAGTAPVALDRGGSGTEYSSNTPGSGSSLSAKFNGAGYFTATIANMPTNNFAIEAWFKPTSTADSQFIFSL